MAQYFSLLLPELTQWIAALARQKSTPWIFLRGELGAGKTTLARELLQALGFEATEVQSPTFLKVLTYRNSAGETALHMDAYRIENPDEFLRLGLENIEAVKVGIVEWPDVFDDFLRKYPAFKDALDIRAVLTVELPPTHDVTKIRLTENRLP